MILLRASSCFLFPSPTCELLPLRCRASRFLAGAGLAQRRSKGALDEKIEKHLWGTERWKARFHFLNDHSNRVPLRL